MTTLLGTKRCAQHGDARRPATARRSFFSHAPPRHRGQHVTVPSYLADAVHCAACAAATSVRRSARGGACRLQTARAARQGWPTNVACVVHAYGLLQLRMRSRAHHVVRRIRILVHRTTGRVRPACVTRRRAPRGRTSFHHRAWFAAAGWDRQARTQPSVPALRTRLTYRFTSRPARGHVPQARFRLGIGGRGPSSSSGLGCSSACLLIKKLVKYAAEVRAVASRVRDDAAHRFERPRTHRLLPSCVRPRHFFSAASAFLADHLFQVLDCGGRLGRCASNCRPGRNAHGARLEID